MCKPGVFAGQNKAEEEEEEEEEEEPEALSKIVASSLRALERSVFGPLAKERGWVLPTGRIGQHKSQKIVPRSPLQSLCSILVAPSTG